ncbi:MAG: SCO family protein [bacterium]
MSENANRPNVLRWAIVVMGVLIVGLALASARLRGGGRAGSELPVYGEVPAFALTESSGRTLSRDDLLGKPWIADFIFTRCSGTCPVMTSSMSGLHEAFAEARDVNELRFVSFTVDPEWDTPEVLRSYAEGIAADPERWLFLTGDRAAIYALSQQGFHLGAGDDVATSEIMHSTRFVLVDRAGRIRGYYDGMEPEAVAQLAKDARVIARERTAAPPPSSPSPDETRTPDKTS